ncbi:SET and MYND domain-containing protein 4-like protein [Dinothrombium tinctorium]|uniref:SET and MYND domain-containing protein 4-like protein n=1 Tax=Dinothrombium tinctorium TaxID=1965070 RepID=A0A3S3PJX4_9ACAR|nr:SET and MYND domain-containing protein 4-like protein [Dinothrombium tinctorium]
MKLYYELQHYKQCVEDIDMLFTLKPNDSTKTKMSALRVWCLTKISKIAPEDYRLNFEVNTNPFLENACDGMRIFVDENKGRCVKATEKIKNGKVLVAQWPLVAWLRPSLYRLYCNYCFRRLNSQLYPCLKCTKVRYCCRICQIKAWKDYHSIECAALGSLKKASFGHMALRLAIRYGFDNTLSAEEKAYCEQYFGNNTRSVKSLVSKYGKCDQIFRVYMIIAAILMTKIAERLSITDHKRHFAVNASVLVEFIFKILVNCYYIYDEDVKRSGYWDILTSSSKTFEIGIGIYSTASLFAHSCDSNAHRFCLGSKLVLLASNTIEIGEEICINYGTWLSEYTYEERRNFLLETFGFICMCAACRDKAENVQFALRCPKCDNALIWNSKNVKENHCLGCDAKHLDLSKQFEMIAAADRFSEYGRSYLKSKDFDTALIFLQKAERLYAEEYFSSALDSKLLHELFLCYMRLNQFEKAYDYCLRSALATKLNSGVDSIEYIGRKLNFVQMLVEKRKFCSNKEAFLLVGKARKQFMSALALLRNIIEEKEVKVVSEDSVTFLANIREFAATLDVDLSTILKFD